MQCAICGRLTILKYRTMFFPIYFLHFLLLLSFVIHCLKEWLIQIQGEEKVIGFWVLNLKSQAVNLVTYVMSLIKVSCLSTPDEVLQELRKRECVGKNEFRKGTQETPWKTVRLKNKVNTRLASQVLTMRDAKTSERKCWVVCPDRENLDSLLESSLGSASHSVKAEDELNAAENGSEEAQGFSTTECQGWGKHRNSVHLAETLLHKEHLRTWLGWCSSDLCGPVTKSRVDFEDLSRYWHD